MASDNWRDQHRHPSGKFIPRPGAKGFKPPTPKDPGPVEDGSMDKPRGSLSKWVASKCTK